MKVSIEKFLLLKKSIKNNTDTKILSSSMEPYIYKDDIIKVSPAKPEQLGPGSPIVFWSKNKLVCHFYIKEVYKDDKLYILTKGLNNDEFDDLVESNLILGIVTSPYIPKWKRIVFGLYFRFFS